MIDKWWAKDEWVALIMMIGYTTLQDYLPTMWTERIILIALACIMIYHVIQHTLHIAHKIKLFPHNLQFFINRPADIFIVWLIPVLFKIAFFYLVYVVLMIDLQNLWNYLMVFGGIILVLIMFDEYFERHSEMRKVMYQDE